MEHERDEPAEDAARHPEQVNTAQFNPWAIGESGSAPKQIGHAYDSVGVSTTSASAMAAILVVARIVSTSFNP